MRGVAATLPPPWATRVDAVVWWHRAAPAAADALPPPLRHARRLSLTVAALVRYRATPVGPYHELLATPVLLLEHALPTGHLPFIAVDSHASAEAGREHWALPKVRAAFAWPDALPGKVTASAADGRWHVEATLAARGPRLPLAGAARCRQVRPGGGAPAFAVQCAGLGRPARVHVTARGDGFPAWLRAGRHAAVLLTAARLRVGAPAA